MQGLALPRELDVHYDNKPGHWLVVAYSIAVFVVAAY
jgi:hypothetical protein